MTVFGFFLPTSPLTTAALRRLMAKCRLSFSSFARASSAPRRGLNFQALCVAITLSSVYGGNDRP